MFIILGSDSEDEEKTENVFGEQKNSQEQGNNFIGQQQSKIAVSIFAGQGVVDVFPHARVSVNYSTIYHCNEKFLSR
jgi:hypothetical protein